METVELLEIVARDEDSQHQFKANVTNAQQLSEELVAFSNSGGGRILIGVNNDGTFSGLTREDMGRLNQLISNTCTQNVHPPINVRTENVAVPSGLVMVVSVPDGIGKPYMDNKGAIPPFVVKAIAYPGTEIGATEYVDSEDFSGKIENQYRGGMSFVLRNLRHVQKDQGINTLGIPEVPKIVFEELIANALIHRDYFISAAVRIFVYSDRIEIISPGHLPNNLTVENIKRGNSNIRNPILASYATKILPYRGLGSGIIRAMKAYPRIDFENDVEGNLFKAIVWRTGWQAASGTGGEENGSEEQG
jgi:predicted HTH transcriptional regulator